MASDNVKFTPGQTGFVLLTVAPGAGVPEQTAVDVYFASSMPVSYTHLDVYKRQGNHIIICTI